MIPACQAPSHLYWKYEDGPETEELVDSPDDVGPAWIDHADGASEKVKGGEWITRAEAKRPAADNRYQLLIDD